MRKPIIFLSFMLMMLVTLTACSYEDEYYDDEYYDEDSGSYEEQLEAQLGLLNDYISDDEWEEALYLLEEIDYLREEWLAEGEFEKSKDEEALLEELNWLYDDCTEYYLLDEDEYYDEDYKTPKEKTLATYKVRADGSLRLAGNGSISGKCPWDDDEIKDVWNEIMDILPEGTEEYFVKLQIFTDGEEETLAYVEQVDDYGETWMLAIDPADYDDRDIFVETIVHEFFHCVTLNDEQVLYSDEPDIDEYTEEYEEEAYCIYPEGSYVADFYQEFWTDYIDDREINPESEYFYLRHEDDFVTEYAASMPAEDICESFTYFVLYDETEGKVAQQKIDFFYDYPEFVEYREEIRDNLGM